MRHTCWRLEGGSYGSTSVVIVDAVSDGDAGVREMDGTAGVCACESTADVDCDGSDYGGPEAFLMSSPRSRPHSMEYGSHLLYVGGSGHPRRERQGSRTWTNCWKRHVPVSLPQLA
jgi:hypothetical protein